MLFGVTVRTQRRCYDVYAVDSIKNHMCKENILQLLDKLDIPYTDEGNEARMACPIHGGSNPTAFSWSYDNGIWFCFTGCGSGGSVLDFVRDYFDAEDLSFPELIEKTAQVLEIDITGLSTEAMNNTWVQDTRRWIRYMRSKKEISNSIWNPNKLGNLYPINSYRTFDSQTLALYGVFYSQRYDRVAALLHDEHGDCIGASLRATKPSQKPKWLHSPKHIATGEILYNLHRQTSRTVYVVEGIWDALNMVSLGYPNVVAVLGSSISDGQYKLLIQRFTDVILMFDNDKAGRKATEQSIKKLKNVTNLYVMPLGEFSDPGEVTKEYMNNNLPISSCNYN